MTAREIETLLYLPMFQAAQYLGQNRLLEIALMFEVPLPDYAPELSGRCLVEIVARHPSIHALNRLWRTKAAKDMWYANGSTLSAEEIHLMSRAFGLAEIDRKEEAAEVLFQKIQTIKIKQNEPQAETV